MHEIEGDETFFKVFRKRMDLLFLCMLLLVYCVISYVAFNLNLDILPSLHDTPIYHAFEDPWLIYIGIIVNVSTSIPTVMDLIMDIKSYRDLTFEDEDDQDLADHDTWIERFFLAALSIIPSAYILLFRGNMNIPYIYAIVHTLQTLGSIGMVLLICKRQVPKHFTSYNIHSTMVFTTLTSISSIIGFGHEILYLPNILTFVFISGGFYCITFKICVPWMRDSWVFISKKYPFSIGESCATWYFMNTMINLMLLHSLVTTIKLYDWTKYDSLDINIFVYSFAAYSVVNSTVPGRLARIAVENERKKLVKTKRALIRYMSHEVRSPLNVIHTGLSLLVADMESLPPTEEKENLLETFSSIRHASGDLLQTMNDLLLLESMDSAAFSIEEKMISCANLTQIAEYSGLMPREKGILFNVNNQFEVASPDLLPSMRDGQPNPAGDIEEGGVDNSGPVPEAGQLLFIDEHKIGQVMRNLITNSAKFTPAGQSISVNIRPATSADLTEADDLSETRDHAIMDRRARAISFARDKGYALHGEVLIEVMDTGVGIEPENFGRVFGQFAQFDASKLQVRAAIDFG